MSVNPLPPGGITNPVFVPTGNPPGVPSPPSFPQDAAYDWGIGDLLEDGGGNLLEADGHGSWIDWCLRSTLVQRASSQLYSFNYGMDWAGSIRARIPRASQVALFKQNLQFCLERGDQWQRTLSVRNIVVNWVANVFRFSSDVSSADMQVQKRIVSTAPPGVIPT